MDKVLILLFWGPGLLWCEPERQYFRHGNASTWDEARRHCKVCYKELVTLTPQNVQTVQNLDHDYWIGLRKNFDRSARPWSRWANGDPLTFQNWYPGRPLPHPAHLTGACPVCECCCYDGCRENRTANTMEAALWGTPNAWVSGRLNGTTEDDASIESPCVAVLSMGAWFEKECTEKLPYICYEEHFAAEAQVASVTSTSATVIWQSLPGGVSHYRLEVRGHSSTMVRQNLTYGLTGLTEGTGYSVGVFPIKCGRELNPQNVSFITMPGKVQNLTVDAVTDKTVHLYWQPPVGNLAFYRVTCKDRPDLDIYGNTTRAEVKDLTPGGLYTFHVMAAVGDKLGTAASVTTLTKPGKVSNLTVSENMQDSLLLRWTRPEGKLSGYRVNATNVSNHVLFDEEVDQKFQSKTVTGLTPGAELWISVTALATAGNFSQEGDQVTVVNFTAPGPISNLSLSTTTNTITAIWLPPPGSYKSFDVEFQMAGSQNITRETTSKTKLTQSDLKVAANYTVKIHTVNGHLFSTVVVDSCFTKPVKPGPIQFQDSNRSHIALEWEPPRDTGATRYLVKYHAAFWGHRGNLEVNDTGVTVGGLHAGTKYVFEVQTLAGILFSEATRGTRFTDADKRRVTLSMLCSSDESLFCDSDATRKKVHRKLKEHFSTSPLKDVFLELP